MQTPDEYEMMVFNIWFNWCLEKSKSTKTLQKLTTSAHLFNWWQRELHRLEQIFLKETLPFDDQDHAKRLYAEFTVEIFDRFSKPLLKKAIKSQ